MKALMVAIQPKWLKMILDSKKKFVFRNWKVPVGTVLYFYCTKAKPYLWYEQLYTDTPLSLYSDEHSLNYLGITQDDVLNGKVVAKAVVKEVSVWEKENVFRVITDKWYPVRFRIIGFDENKPSKYAIELDQVEEIEPKDITEFVSWNRYKKNNKEANKFFIRLGPYDDSMYSAVNKNLKKMRKEYSHLTKPPQSRTWVYVEEEQNNE